MKNKSLKQRLHLLRLSYLVWRRKQPLGIGLKNQCWAGVAIETAKANQYLTTDFYGLTMKEIKRSIKENNVTPSEVRNRVMAIKTFLQAIS